MGVSALRVAACVGVLVGLLVLGTGSAVVAIAAPGDDAPSQSDEKSSNAPGNEGAGQDGVNHEAAGEEHQSATEPNVATSGDAGEPAPETAATTERAAASDGAESGSGTEGAVTVESGGGSDYGEIAPAAVAETGDGGDSVDNAAAKVEPEPVPKVTGFASYPFPYYLVIRRDGGAWWNANQIISRFLGVTKPQPEPEPTPSPAFRGGAPQPEPVLDASGGVTGGGGSDYQATGFGAAPVISAPIVAPPAPPPASARFPSFPAAATTAGDVGSAAARTGYAESASTAEGVRPAGQLGQPPAGTVKAMSGQTPPRGYTDYLRSPTLGQLAGAALPGVAGILLMTFGGGVIGYRQAEAGRMIRAGGAARYLP